MSPSAAGRDEAAIVEGQLGRIPRPPWRVAARCTFGYPSAIVSPSVLEDGTPFPTYAWLTCPWLSREVGALESHGGVAKWAGKVSGDPDLEHRLSELETRLRSARAVESGGSDACASVGISGQRDFRGVKCLHAHVALELAGLDDPIGAGIIEFTGVVCPDRRCARYDVTSIDSDAESKG